MIDERERLELFYGKPFDFSYSSLNKLMYSPMLFYRHYVLRTREELTDAHLVAGKVTHCLLLDDGSFEHDFIVSPAKLPGDNSRLLVDRVYETYTRSNESDDTRSELSEYRTRILSVMRDMNYFQNLKTDDQRIEKILTDENVSYFNFLKVRQGKTLVDEKTLQECKLAVEAVRNDEKASGLLKLKYRSTDLLQIYNEHAIRMDLQGYPFGLKGIIDNFVLDFENRTIHINDLKVTGKSLADFKDSLVYYMYWMQAAIYSHLVTAVESLRDINTTDWTVKFHFIVIDKYLQVYAFPVGDKTMIEWQGLLGDRLEKARYHYENRYFRLPMEFAMNQVEF